MSGRSGDRAVRARRATAALAVAAVAAAGAGCSDVSPKAEADAAVEGADAAATPEPDAGACEAPAGVAGGKRVKMLYLVPSDVTPDDAVVGNLEQALHTLQMWLPGVMPGDTSIRVADPAVEVAVSTHPAAYFAENVNDSAEDLRFWRNALDDAMEVAAVALDTDVAWLIYVDADQACGQRGAVGFQNVAVFPRNDLRGMLDVPRVPICDGDTPDARPRCRWIGGMTLLFLNALDVPYPAGCLDEDEETDCPDDNFMRFGWDGFPDEGTFLKDQLEHMAATGFIDAIGLPTCEIDCSVVVP